MLRHQLLEGNWLQLAFYRLLQYGLRSRFSTSAQIIFSRGGPLTRRAPRPIPPVLKSTGFHFPPETSTIVSPEQSYRTGVSP